MPVVMSLRQTVSAALTATLLATLSACGGGGGGSDTPCGGSGTLNVAITYEVNGVVVDPDRTVLLNRGAANLAAPRIVGLPAACNGAAHLSVTSRSATVPVGMSFDAATGVLGGTPTVLSNFIVDMTLSIDGYSNTIRQSVIFFM